MDEYEFRQAKPNEASAIWSVLQEAIERRKADGSTQWQDGYPNLQVVEQDIERGIGYVLVDGEQLVGYCAILIDDEPAYQNIEGSWLTEASFVVYHRVAISSKYIGMGMAQRLLLHVEEFAKKNHIYSLRVDTNFDNAAMLRIFEKMGYQYRGQVLLRGSARKAFEKLLNA